MGFGFLFIHLEVKLFKCLMKVVRWRDPYIGDMSANLKIADAAEVSERYGAYKNELQTSKEPYGWTIILEEPISPSQETKTRQKMLSDACLIIASVDNLGVVTWRY